MEFVVYVSIGVACVSVFSCLIGVMYWIYDKKRHERAEQEEAAQLAVTR